jgi:two-component system invasion response regulator UvrY
MKKITVVIIDDHKLIREMWTKLFATRNDIQVVGECSSFDEAIKITTIKRPDIVLLDINLPPNSGLDAVPLILKFSPGTKIIGISMHTQPVYARKMITLGARGYVTKNSSYQDMFDAIDEVMRGNIYVCTEMKNILSNRQLFNDEAMEPGTKHLTFREIEVIKFTKKGLTSKEMSAQLNISIRTVDVHRQNILKKLKLKNTVSLINFINTNDLQF